MALVRSREEIRFNVETLRTYLASSIPKERKFALDLVRRGTCFVISKSPEGAFFAPSRFVGYRNNSLAAQKSQPRDGGETNDEISDVLKSKPTRNEIAEKLYLECCRSIGVKPSAGGSFGIKRRYWIMDPGVNVRPFRQRLRIVVGSESDPASTERESLILSRVGQDKFRKKLIQYWGKCAVTGCDFIAALKASHIRGWSEFKNGSKEKLDVFNGLLLIPNLDSLFDKALISFGNDGEILISKVLSTKARRQFGLSTKMKVDLDRRHQQYMLSHRLRFYRLEERGKHAHHEKS